MIVPIREIANKNSFLCKSAMFHSMEMNTIFKDVNMNRPRNRSSTLSPNSSRELLTYSDLLSQLYTNKIEVENEKLFWDKQVKSQNFQLSYQFIKK